MGTTTAIGSDGSVTMPTGYKAQLNTWSATISRTTSVVTGFGDSGASRVASAVVDITGSAGGVPEYNAATTSAVGIDGSAAGGNIVLGWNDIGGTADCSIAFDAVFGSVAFASTQDGDATVTFNFEVASTAAPVFTWYEV
jgi:hypothetical protein